MRTNTMSDKQIANIQIEKQTEGQTNIWTDKQMGRQIDKETEGQANR
jgi:hypothetical protein